MGGVGLLLVNAAHAKINAPIKIIKEGSRALNLLRFTNKVVNFMTGFQSQKLYSHSSHQISDRLPSVDLRRKNAGAIRSS